MLDLTKLANQLEGVSHHLTQEAAASRRRLEIAQQLLETAIAQQSHHIAHHDQWRDRLSFTAAIPVEPLTTRISLNSPPDRHTVFATDGSQIAPSHHEIAYCYLINIGRVILHYGQNRQPILDSFPEVFYRPEDLYISRQWGIRTEEWMGYRRTVSETIALAEIAESLSATATAPSSNSRCSDSPTIALLDGSLIYWFLESLPGEARALILPPILEAWERLRRARIPIVGYLSASRNSEALNFLRLPACPFPEPDCLTHCQGAVPAAASRDKPRPLATPPCQVFDPLRDTALWALLLEPGQRSPFWRSSAKVLEVYGNQTIYFCYVHVGTEIARIECPAWVFEDETLRDLALSLTLAQVQKGYGYPVALAEAHNQAVVRGRDRAHFFSLLEQQMIRAGLQNVGTSYKEARKRGSIA